MSSRHVLATGLSLIAYAFAQDAQTTAASSAVESMNPSTSASSTTTAAPAATSKAAASSNVKVKYPDHADEYAGWMVSALFVLAFIIFLYRLTRMSIRHFRHLVSLTHDQQNFFRQPDAMHSWFKRNIMYAPLFGKRHTNEIKLTRWWGVGILPTRLQLLVLLLIIGGNVFYCLYNVPFSSPATVFVPVLRARTGIAATVNCIPLVLFAARNNPLIWVLDLPFDTFNLLHRWYGRMIVIQASVHVIAWACQKQGGLPAVGAGLTVGTTLINSALVSTLAVIMIPIQASSVLRHAFYETFVHVHQALALTVFVSLWFHLKALPDPRGTIYIDAVFATWALERFVRFLTLAYRNVGSTRTMATVEALPGDALRVTLSLSRPWRMRAGQHMFLTVPSVGLWTSHPFSVAWSSDNPVSSFELGMRGGSKLDIEKGLSSPVSSDEITSAGGQHTVSAIVRARSGFTASLLKKATNAPQGKICLPAFAEGPYGQAHTMASYGTVLLFAGGVGITHILPYVRSLVAGAAGHTVATRRVTLVWIIQSPEHLEWIRPWMTSILAMEGRREVLRIEIFITRPRSAREIRSPSSTVRMYAGRPVVGEIIAREVQSAIGATGISVCGPGGLGDEVRKGVRHWCETAEVDLLEESFSW